MGFSEVPRALALRERLALCRDALLESLISVEDRATAISELVLVDEALRQWDQADALLGERRPLGRVAVMTPATLPAYSTLIYAGAAAISGNEVCMRPSRGGVEPAKIMVEEVFGPAGVNIAVSTESGRQFIDSSLAADAVVFTGLPENAARIAEKLQDSTTLVYQGPGVCAAVIRRDADIEQAVATVVADRLFNMGQDCLSIERLYVDRAVLPEVISGIKRLARTHRWASRDDPVGAQLFPLLDPVQFQRRLDHAFSQATDVHLEGGCVAEGTFALTVLEAEPDSGVVLREAFGPILPIVAYSDEVELREMLELGDFALGLESFGGLPSFGVLDFAHVAVDSSLYDYESFLCPFGGYRETTFVRSRDGYTNGPHWLPHVLTGERTGGF